MATGTVDTLSAIQLDKLADAMQAKLDVIKTADRRAGVISRSIIKRAMNLSDNLYPKAKPLVDQQRGLPVFEAMIDETSELAEDVNDWIDTLAVLGNEYDSLRVTIEGFRERLP